MASGRLTPAVTEIVLGFTVEKGMSRLVVLLFACVMIQGNGLGDSQCAQVRKIGVNYFEFKSLISVLFSLISSGIITLAT